MRRTKRTTAGRVPEGELARMANIALRTQHTQTIKDRSSDAVYLALILDGDFHFI